MENTGCNCRLRLEYREDLAHHAAPEPWAPAWYLERVREAVDGILTDKQREVVELFYFQGWTEQQIAAHLGIRQQVVHKRIHGAVRGGKRVGGALSRLRTALMPVAEVERWV